MHVATAYESLALLWLFDGEMVYLDMRRFDEAENTARKCLEIRRKVYGAANINTVRVVNFRTYLSTQRKTLSKVGFPR